MLIHVQSHQGHVLQLEVKSNETIASLKARLSCVDQDVASLRGEAGIRVDQQRIIFAGKQLKDESTLADYNVKNNSFLHLLRRLRGGAPTMSKEPVWLETVDGDVEEVEREVALLSPLVQREVLKYGNGTSRDAPVVLPKQVSPSVLKLILAYCRYHRVPGRSDKERKNFDEKFIRLDTRKLCELTSAADSLDMKPLVDLTSRALARMIEGKTPEEIRETFHLPDDLTEEEKLEPVKNATDDPRVRLLNRLYARKRKELQDRKMQQKAICGRTVPVQSKCSGDRLTGPGIADSRLQVNNAELLEDRPVDERSVDDLLSFIDGGSQDNKGNKAKAKKKKKHKKKDSEHEDSQSTTTSANQIKMQEKRAASSTHKDKEKCMECDSPQNKSEKNGSSIVSEGSQSVGDTMFDEAEFDDDDGLDPAMKEKLDREVEDFARRLNADWPDRMQEILALASSSQETSSHASPCAHEPASCSSLCLDSDHTTFFYPHDGFPPLEDDRAKWLGNGPEPAPNQYLPSHSEPAPHLQATDPSSPLPPAQPAARKGSQGKDSLRGGGLRRAVGRSVGKKAGAAESGLERHESATSEAALEIAWGSHDMSGPTNHSEPDPTDETRRLDNALHGVPKQDAGGEQMYGDDGKERHVDVDAFGKRRGPNTTPRPEARPSLPWSNLPVNLPELPDPAPAIGIPPLLTDELLRLGSLSGAGGMPGTVVWGDAAPFGNHHLRSDAQAQLMPPPLIPPLLLPSFAPGERVSAGVRSGEPGAPSVCGNGSLHLAELTRGILEDLKRAEAGSSGGFLDVGGAAGGRAWLGDAATSPRRGCARDRVGNRSESDAQEMGGVLQSFLRLTGMDREVEVVRLVQGLERGGEEGGSERARRALPDVPVRTRFTGYGLAVSHKLASGAVISVTLSRPEDSVVGSVGGADPGVRGADPPVLDERLADLLAEVDLIDVMPPVACPSFVGNRPLSAGAVGRPPNSGSDVARPDRTLSSVSQ